MSNSKLDREKQKQERLGEVRYNNNGERMVIIEYNNATDITIQFDNGYKVYKARYTNFERGNVLNPINKAEGRIGEINYNRFGSKMTIIEYISESNITLQFDNGYIYKNALYGNFKKGSVKSPYCKSLYGVGYFGEGKYKCRINGIDVKQYKTWQSMMQRCYDHKTQEKSNRVYKGCTVCDEWHNYQVFASWHEKNYYNVGDEMICLDKDILVKNNKCYSPETAIFVPERINKLFLRGDSRRGKYPIGITQEDCGNFIVHCSIGIGEPYYLGYFKNIQEAFQIYKETKENYIKQVANEYKGKIPNNLYQAMIDWKVEITD